MQIAHVLSVQSESTKDLVRSGAISKRRESFTNLSDLTFLDQLPAHGVKLTRFRLKSEPCRSQQGCESPTGVSHAFYTGFQVKSRAVSAENVGFSVGSWKGLQKVHYTWDFK